MAATLACKVPPTSNVSEATGSWVITGTLAPTVMVELVPVIPLNVALIVAAPWAMAVTTPLLLTVTAPGLLLTQLVAKAVTGTPETWTKSTLINRRLLYLADYHAGIDGNIHRLWCGVRHNHTWTSRSGNE